MTAHFTHTHAHQTSLSHPKDVSVDWHPVMMHCYFFKCRMNECNMRGESVQPVILLYLILLLICRVAWFKQLWMMHSLSLIQHESNYSLMLITLQRKKSFACMDSLFTFHGSDAGNNYCKHPSMTTDSEWMNREAAMIKEVFNFHC